MTTMTDFTCFDEGVCHECDSPLTSGLPIEVTIHDDSGFHTATCQVCDDCASLITLPVDVKAEAR